MSLRFSSSSSLPFRTPIIARLASVLLLAALPFVATGCSDDGDDAGSRDNALDQNTAPKACTVGGESSCDAGQFCAPATAGTCGGTGTCTARPEVCTEECASPMLCGCDGKLYCNACLANGAGTSIATDASLCGDDTPPSTGACGGASGGTCAADEFCDQSGATSCGAEGTCKPKPEVCTEECMSPMLCGCDGKLHCTACQANSAGVSISPDASLCADETPPSTGTCGGPDGATCADNEFCDRPAATACGGVGTCKPKPELCTQECASPMLCGCDGKLYCNACLANGAGTSISNDASVCPQLRHATPRHAFAGVPTRAPPSSPEHRPEDRGAVSPRSSGRCVRSPLSKALSQRLFAGDAKHATF